MRLILMSLSAFSLIMPSMAGPPAQPVNASAQKSIGAVAAPVAQPNFVVIVTDDQKWDSIGRCSPVLDPYDFDAGSNACMPNLQDDLMDAGTTFLKGEVTQSLCCPSRASILTGQYSTTTGVTVNDGDKFKDQSTVATWLNDAGYRTGLFGKYLNGYGDGHVSTYIPPGWDAFEAYHGFRNTSGDDPYTDYPWISWEAGGAAPLLTRYKDADSTNGNACAAGNLYSTDLVCRRTLDFIAADQSNPFFVYVAPASPHRPYSIAARHKGKFANITVPQYPDTNLVPSPNPPSYLPTQALSTRTLNAQTGIIKDSLELTLPVDDMIGALHDQLVADGRLDNTVWIFISDNGMAHGEHRWTAKRCEYYVCHRVPFVVVCPPAICGGAQQGTTDPNNYALNIDIAPTVADLAGVTPTLPVDGRSLAPILANPSATWRTEWFMHGSDPAYEGIVGVGLDAKTYKYVELTSAGQFELYNLDGDPWELTNLAGNAGYSAIQADLAARLATHLGGPPANQPPVAAFTQSCSDLTCVFTDASTDSDGSVVSWAWNFGDGTASSAEDPTHSYGTAGTYSATLTVTDDDGATSAVTHSITVTNPNGPPVAGFTSACTALTCDFTDTSAGSVVSWLWTFGDGSSSTAQDPSHSYGTAGTYTVTLDVTDDQGATGAASSSVTVSEPGAATTMHVTDLDGTRANQRGSWLATVHIYVGNELGGVVSSAQVTISRRNGTTSSCTTNAAGYCFVQFTVQGPKEVFTVTGVTHPTLTYQAGDNADPDGDSTGTQITILRS